jgi:hypothetical protein
VTRTTLKTLLTVVLVTVLGAGTAAGQPRPSPFDPPVKKEYPIEVPELQKLWDDLYGPIKPAVAKPVSPAWTDLLGRVMDTKRMPAERATVLRWSTDFPNLGDDFEVIGPGTRNPTRAREAAFGEKARAGQVIPGTYNCIAHTAGIKNVWVNPYQTVEGWDLFYGPLGYRASDRTDTSLEAGLQKVAVYATRAAGRESKEYTHAAIQDGDGTWTSKLGSGPLIRHRTADAVSGPAYGEVVRVYSRKRP